METPKSSKISRVPTVKSTQSQFRTKRLRNDTDELHVTNKRKPLSNDGGSTVLPISEEYPSQVLHSGPGSGRSVPINRRRTYDVLPRQQDNVTLQQMDDVTPRQRDDVTPRQRDDVTPRQQDDVTPRQRDDVIPRRSDDVTPQQPGSSRQGSKFSTPVIMEDEVLGEVPKSASRCPSTNSAKKKKKRRSSFVRGRISKVVSQPRSADISFDFPDELSPEDRLSKLATASLQYTLEKLHEENVDMDGFQQFKVKARLAGEECIKDLVTRNIFKTATNIEDKFLPNPGNEMLEKTIGELTTYTDRLKSESDRWEEILQEQTDHAEQAQQTYRDIENFPITEMPLKGFTVHQQKILSDAPNYNHLLDRLQDHKEHLIFGVQNMVSVVKTILNFQHLANIRLDEYAKRIYKRTFGDDPIIEDPQQLIINCLQYKEEVQT